MVGLNWWDFFPLGRYLYRVNVPSRHLPFIEKGLNIKQKKKKTISCGKKAKVAKMGTTKLGDAVS